MNAPNQASSTPPLLPYKSVAKAVSGPRRWEILAELSDGQPRMVNEIARVVGISKTAASKQLAVLRRLGVVVQTRRCYQIPAQFIASAEKRHLEFGHCLMRLPGAAGRPVM